jgi:hypothetical protein
MAIKYVLLGLRSGNDHEGSQQALDGRMVAILKSVSGGRRLTAYVNRRDCTSWPECRAKIVAYLNKDGIKRVDESEIGDPPLQSSDLPFVPNPAAQLGQPRVDFPSVANDGVSNAAHETASDALRRAMLQATTVAVRSQATTTVAVRS